MDRITKIKKELVLVGVPVFQTKNGRQLCAFHEGLGTVVRITVGTSDDRIDFYVEYHYTETHTTISVLVDTIGEDYEFRKAWNDLPQPFVYIHIKPITNWNSLDEFSKADNLTFECYSRFDFKPLLEKDKRKRFDVLFEEFMMAYIIRSFMSETIEFFIELSPAIKNIKIPKDELEDQMITLVNYVIQSSAPASVQHHPLDVTNTCSMIITLMKSMIQGTYAGQIAARRPMLLKLISGDLNVQQPRFLTCIHNMLPHITQSNAKMVDNFKASKFYTGNVELCDEYLPSNDAEMEAFRRPSLIVNLDNTNGVLHPEEVRVMRDIVREFTYDCFIREYSLEERK